MYASGLAPVQDSFVLDDLNVDVHGDGRQPHLLLVHGFMSSRAQWRANLAALAEVSTPVVVELLGHGRSGSPRDPAAYAVSRYLERFEAVRRRVGAQTWFVCGQSFGAGLTIRYAIQHPDRVSGQVFTNSVSALSKSRGEASEREARAAAIEAGGHAALAAAPAYPRPSRRLPPDSWEQLVADGALLSPLGVANGVRVTAVEVSVADDLARVKRPTLLVNGRRETAFQPLRDAAAQGLPELQIVDVEGGGHSVNIDSPDAFDDAVTAFIRRHSASP